MKQIGLIAASALLVVSTAAFAAEGMKCGAGKCGKAMQEKKKEKKEKKKAMKCGAGKCGSK